MCVSAFPHTATSVFIEVAGMTVSVDGGCMEETCYCNFSCYFSMNVLTVMPPALLTISHTYVCMYVCV